VALRSDLSNTSFRTRQVRPWIPQSTHIHAWRPQTKLISHAIRIAAFNTATALARAIRIHTGYARANHEAHALARQALTGSGDIDPSDGTLTIRLDPLPTQRATTAIAQLCEHLTATQTRYPGTDLILRYEIKTHP
jgi:hypothetical protein